MPINHNCVDCGDVCDCGALSEKSCRSCDYCAGYEDDDEDFDEDDNIEFPNDGRPPSLIWG